VGPTVPVTTTGGPVGSLYDTPMRVTVSSPRSLQGLPVDWSQVRLRVESSKLSGPLEKTVQTSDNQVTVEFRVPPGPVTVSAELLLSGVVVAVGSTQEVISPGITKNLVIAMATTNTSVSTLAGKKTPFYGDGLPAVESWLESPEAIAMDAAGNLYVADTAERFIRRISGISPHVSTTILGPDVLTSAPNALAYDGGNYLYYTLNQSSTLYRVNLATKQVTAVRLDLEGSNGLLYHPDGYLFVSDAVNKKIWKVSATGDSITEFLNYQLVNSAVGEAFESPAGMALNPEGTILYVADTDVQRVWSVNIATKLVQPFAGTGEWGYISPQEEIPALVAPIPTPYGLATSALGEVFISSRNGNQVYQVSTDGTLTVLAGMGEGEPSVADGPARLAVLAGPRGIAVNSVGDVFVADSGNHRIRRVTGQTNPEGGLMSTYAGRSGALNYYGGDEQQPLPFNKAVFNEVRRVAVDDVGNVYVADHENARVRVLAKVSGSRFGLNLVAGHDYTVLGNGYFEGFSYGYPGFESSMGKPSGLAFDDQQNLYVADSLHGTIVKVDRVTGVLSMVADSGFSGLVSPEGMAYAGGKLYVADSGAHKVWEIDVTSMQMTAVAGTGQPGLLDDDVNPLDAPLKQPFDVAVDADNNLLIAETGNDVIRIVARTGVNRYGKNLVVGTMYRLAGRVGMTGSFVAENVVATDSFLNKPHGIELDSFGNLIIASSDQHRLRIVDRGTGKIRTLVGYDIEGSEDGVGAYDGYPGDARLRSPWDVARGPHGILYIADALNHAVRQAKQSGL